MHQSRGHDRAQVKAVLHPSKRRTKKQEEAIHRFQLYSRLDVPENNLIGLKYGPGLIIQKIAEINRLIEAKAETILPRAMILSQLPSYCHHQSCSDELKLWEIIVSRV